MTRTARIVYTNPKVKKIDQLITSTKNDSNDPDMSDIDSAVKSGTAEFNLEDVKVSFNRDIKIDVSGVHVDATQGEILNIPRWVANVLEDDDHGQIQDTDMFVELKQALVKENVKGEFDIATLERHFYIKLSAYLKRMSESDRNIAESMLNTLVRKRQGKIIRTADSSAMTAEIGQKLTIEEQVFYNTIYQNSKNFKEKITGVSDE